MTGTSEPVLALRELRRNYGRIEAVAGIALQVDAGERLALRASIIPVSLRGFLGVSLRPDNPEGAWERVGGKGDFQLRLGAEGIILEDDDGLMGS
jgi:hypothetical protein